MSPTLGERSRRAWNRPGLRWGPIRPSRAYTWVDVQTAIPGEPMPRRLLISTVLCSALLGAVAATGAERQCGPAGCAQLEPGACANPQSGGAGEDELHGTGRGDRLYGRGGHDRLTSGAGADCLFGGGGPDRLNGNKGTDRVFGGAGDDQLGGDSGRDRLAGGPGRDELSAGSGSDWLLGGLGADLLRAAGGGRDVVRCGRGARPRGRGPPGCGAWLRAGEEALAVRLDPTADVLLGTPSAVADGDGSPAKNRSRQVRDGRRGGTRGTRSRQPDRES